MNKTKQDRSACRVYLAIGVIATVSSWSSHKKRLCSGCLMIGFGAPICAVQLLAAVFAKFPLRPCGAPLPKGEASLGSPSGGAVSAAD